MMIILLAAINRLDGQGNSIYSDGQNAIPPETIYLMRLPYLTDA